MDKKILEGKESELLMNGVKDVIKTLREFKNTWIAKNCAIGPTLIGLFDREFEDQTVKLFGDVRDLKTSLFNIPKKSLVFRRMQSDFATTSGHIRIRDSGKLSESFPQPS